MSNFKNLLKHLKAAMDESSVMMPEMMPSPAMPEMNDSMMNVGEIEMEDSERSMEEESREMLLSDLRSMIVNAQDVITHIESGVEVEAWMNSQVTIAAENISSVRNSLIGEKND